MSNHPIPNPEPAESAMLSVIMEDMLAEAGKWGQAQCTFRQYRIRARRLARSRCRLLIGDKNGTLIDADIRINV